METAMSHDEPDMNPSEQRGGSTLTAEEGSDEPATDTGIDTSAGERADAVTDGGSPPPPPGQEPDLKDAPAGPREPDRESAER
jgi:hypothetical protein